ncbi:prolyl oligopeptidase family serine peptidase [Nocardia sp. NEAU-G5]|uniref:Prolyl oligopeptidase family serine peptidase n=1 Tax=Nocardia albiluteola TaxID=2842303 RepID=A0ABS6B5Q9_9NOCA|nr:prolyl oligopeptidase family serine peptidase [Nocardia albiluteola]MBU3064528.1 prolyl oligopeptidase family serine peptidase [Nocardia albiluteola]
MRSPRSRVLALLVMSFIVLLTPAAGADPESGTVSSPPGRDVTFTGGGGLRLHGTVIASAAPHSTAPGIVLVGGSGPGPRAEYLAEARAFAAAGITTLIYDKRTTGYSRTHRDLNLLADDAQAALETLRHTPGVRPDRVGLWGFSEGGWVVPLVAARSADVAFLVTLGAPGFTPLRTQTWSLAETLRHHGDTGPLAATVEGPAARLVGETGAFPAAEFDPLPALRGVHVPVLALWGDHDVQAVPAESAAVLRNTLTGSDSVTIRFVAGAAHNGRSTTDGFDRVGAPAGPGAPKGAFAPGYLDAMTTWVNQVANGTPAVSSAQPYPAQALSSVDPGHGWWTSAWVQSIVLAMVLVVFLGYLPVSWMNHRPHRARRSARLLAVCGLGSLVATVVYVESIVADDARTVGPVVADRPLVWLILQGLAVLTAVLLVVTASTAVRGRAGVAAMSRAGLGVLLVTGCAWLAWAIAWGLFSIR